MSVAIPPAIEAAVLWSVASNTIPEYQDHRRLALQELAKLGYEVPTDLPRRGDPLPPRRLRVIEGGRP